MPIIDKQGFIHIFRWRINIFDLLVLIFVLCLIPMIPFAYKILNYKPPIIAKTHYTILKVCPICGHIQEIEIPIGKLPPEEYKAKCPNCGNEVCYIKIRLPPDKENLQKEYYMRALERGLP